MEEPYGLEFDSSPISTLSSSSQPEIAREVSILMEKLSPLLEELKSSVDIADFPDFKKAFNSLETDYKLAQEVIGSRSLQSSPAKQTEVLVQSLGRSLGLVLFSSHVVSIGNKEKIEVLCKEMMSVKFDLSTTCESEFAAEAEDEEMEGETEEEIVEEETRIFTVEEAIWQIKIGSGERFKNALLVLDGMIKDGMISDTTVVDEDIVGVLCRRLNLCKGDDRGTVIQILSHLSLQNNQYKEQMKHLEILSLIVKSMARNLQEQRLSVGLLLNLADDDVVRRRIGSIRGCILLLICIANGEDQEASHDARTLLNIMVGNTQHVLYMAEAGYFRPLIRSLKEGSEMSKILMATALSRLELSDRQRASLGEDGAIELLVKMFSTGNLEMKLSALNALQTLSNLHQNIPHLINSGIVAALMQLLFSVTSVLMTLKEPAAAILVQVAKSETIQVKQDVAHQMLSLLSLSSPAIQRHLLEALNNIVSHNSASKARKRMNQSGAIQLLLSFLTERDMQMRTGALKLVYMLSKEVDMELSKAIDYSHLHVIVNIVSTSKSEHEKAAALGILSNLPVSDKNITDMLKNANLLPSMVSIVSSSVEKSTPTTLWLLESIAGVLIRFTVPTDKKLQHYSVDSGVFPVLLKLLSSASKIATSQAALSLAQLSHSSLHLVESQKLKWLCMPVSADSFCHVHKGHCSIKSTFCLVKARALPRLVQVLEVEGEERQADNAVLSCLSTLLQDEIWESGCNYLVKNSSVRGIIKVLSSGSLKSKEKALWILDRVFRIEAHRVEYGDIAQVVLIDLVQNGDPILVPKVAQLLAQLELLQDQSSYFRAKQRLHSSDQEKLFF